MTDAQRDELLINMSTQIMQINGKITNIEGRLTNVEETITDVKKTTINLDGRLTSVEETLTDVKKTTINLDGRLTNVEETLTDVKKTTINLDGRLTNVEEKVSVIDEMKEDLRNLSRTVAKIEVEHGEKLQILLDVVTGQEQKNKEFEKRFEDDERILNRHSDEIYYLKLKENKIKPIL